MKRLITRVMRLRQADSQISSRVRAVLVESLYASPRSLVIGALSSSAIAAGRAPRTGGARVVLCAHSPGVGGGVRIAAAPARRLPAASAP